MAETEQQSAAAAAAARNALPPLDWSGLDTVILARVLSGLDAIMDAFSVSLPSMIGSHGARVNWRLVSGAAMLLPVLDDLLNAARVDAPTEVQRRSRLLS